MASNIAVRSWAAIIHQTEALFCPVVAGSISYPEKVEWKDLEEIKHILGSELTHFLSCDPQIHASVFNHRRINIAWPESRPEIKEKIIRCLRQAGIIMLGIEGKDEELTAHRLSEAACVFYDYGTPLTQEMLELLAIKGRDGDQYAWNLSRLSQIGCSSGEITLLLELDNADFEKAVYIIDQFHQIGFLFSEESIQKLITRLEEIHAITLGLEKSFVPLTKEVCKRILDENEIAIQLANGIRLLDSLEISMQHQLKLFLIQKAAEGKLYPAVKTFEQLNHVGYFNKKWNAPLLVANLDYIEDIKSAIDSLLETDILLTRNFCKLFITLIKDLYPLNEEEFYLLAINSEHAEGIIYALDNLKRTLFPITKDILLFLVSLGDGAREIGQYAEKMKRAIQSAKRICVELELNEMILLMKNARYAAEISNITDFLYEKKIPLSKKNIALLFENGMNAEKIEMALKHLQATKGMVTRNIFLRFLEEGKTAAAINELVYFYL